MNKQRRLAYPYIVLSAVFTIVPLILVFVYAFLKKTPDGYQFTLDNVMRLADAETRAPIIAATVRAFKLSLISTVICLLVGYPLALILASRDFRHKSFLVTLLVLPMWMNFLIRTYAWMGILENTGILNQFLGLFGMGPYQFLYREGAVVMGMIYNFLPFMILPIHSVLVKIDNKLIEAAEDLGASYFTVFRKIIFPLSIGGVASGITMVFMPSVTTFAISSLLGGNKALLIGDLIEKYFLEFNDWGFGALISAILLALILLGTLINFSGSKKKEKGGARA